MAARKGTQKPAGSAAAPGKTSKGFTDEERAAMRERAKELKSAARHGSRAAKAEEDERAVLAKFEEMPYSDRTMAERLHEIIRVNAPGLAPRLWYGMPAYAKDGNVVCFFQSAEKFKTRYSTLGFSDKAALDDGNMWPVAFALTELTTNDEDQIGALVKRAADLHFIR